MRARLLRSLAVAALLPVYSCGDPGGPIGMTWDEIHTVCGSTTTIRGIDVSVYQGTIDWNAAARGGVRFAYMRLANNMTLDTTFVRNWTNSRTAGVLRGAYQYFNPHGDAVAQANFVADTLMRNGFGVGDLPPMIDVEYPNSTSNPLPSRAAYATKVRQWLDTIRTRLGVDGVIYTGGYYWDANLNTAEFNTHAYWHAQYPNYYGANDPRNTIYQFNVTPLPLGGCPTSVSNHWNQWRFWQFAGDNGRAPGVSGPVDCDAFNGTMDDLRRLARLPLMDAGVATDSGVARDATVTDTGVVRDSGGDSAVVRDSGASVDTGVSDATAPVDTGVATDAASPMDSAAPRDSGGSVSDASAQSDGSLDGGIPLQMQEGCRCHVVGGSVTHVQHRGLFALASIAVATVARKRKRARRR